MPLVEIRKVTTKRELKTFIQFHYDLYKGNAYDAPNLFTDEMHTLRKDKNAAFEFCKRWGGKFVHSLLYIGEKER